MELLCPLCHFLFSASLTYNALKPYSLFPQAQYHEEHFSTQLQTKKERRLAFGTGIWSEKQSKIRNPEPMDAVINILQQIINF